MPVFFGVFFLGDEGGSDLGRHDIKRISFECMAWMMLQWLATETIQSGNKMSNDQKFLYAKETELLQVPYDEYTDLMGKAEEAQHLLKVKTAVLADLQQFLEGTPEAPLVEIPVKAKEVPAPKAEPITPKETPAPAPTPISETTPEKVSVEFPADTPEPEQSQAPAAGRDQVSDVPPIKKDIIGHFNKLDESGRLFNVFKQYYTCLNESCGGTVRVTMKDGFCSLWNYDEWEEFAFVDIFENLLRITLDPRYTDALKSLNLCEAPRLISSRRNVVSVQVDDLNNVVLDTLTKAFSEVGVQTK